MSKPLETGLDKTRGVVHELIEADPGNRLLVMLPNGKYHEVETIQSQTVGGSTWANVLVVKQDPTL